MKYVGDFTRTDNKICEFCDWMLGDKTIAELALTNADPKTDPDAQLNQHYNYHSRYEACPPKDTVAIVSYAYEQLPNCDFCEKNNIQKTSYIDGQTIYGPSGYMCKQCFQDYGVGVGQGRGQLLLHNTNQDLDALTVEFIERMTILNLVRRLGKRDEK